MGVGQSPAKLTWPKIRFCFEGSSWKFAFLQCCGFFPSEERKRFNIEGRAFEVKPLAKLILQGVVRISDPHWTQMGNASPRPCCSRWLRSTRTCGPRQVQPQQVQLFLSEVARFPFPKEGSVLVYLLVSDRIRFKLNSFRI